MAVVTDRSGRVLFRGRVPYDDDGRLCKFAVRPRGGAAVYAPTLPEVLSVVMDDDGYAALPPAQRLVTRQQFAVRLATQVQDALVGECATSDHAASVLRASKDNPVNVQMWDQDVPLVLVDHVYWPNTAVFPPAGRVMWLRASDEYLFAVSLADAGLLELAVRP